MGLTEFEFWRLTTREFNARKAEYCRARGIAPPLTTEQKNNLIEGKRYILEAQMRAHNRMIEKRKASRLALVERRKSNG